MIQCPATEPSKTQKDEERGRQTVTTIAPSIGVRCSQACLCSGGILNARRPRIRPKFIEGIVPQGKTSSFQDLQRHPRQWSPCPADCNHTTAATAVRPLYRSEHAPKNIHVTIRTPRTPRKIRSGVPELFDSSCTPSETSNGMGPRLPHRQRHGELLRGQKVPRHAHGSRRA